jgi:hypothetical protein
MNLGFDTFALLREHAVYSLGQDSEMSRWPCARSVELFLMGSYGLLAFDVLWRVDVD